MKRLFAITAFLFIAACSPSESPVAETDVTGQPTETPAGTWDRGAIATAANPHAVNAAIEMLEKAGTPWMPLLLHMQCSAWSNHKVPALAVADSC